jgi:hypothetical protein
MNRVISDLIVEGVGEFYLIQTFTRTATEVDIDTVVNKVRADRVVEMFRDIRSCGAGMRPVLGGTYEETSGSLF